MANLNKVLLMGNLTKDPELRYTAGGSPVANLRMAINHTYKSATGEQKEDVCYLNVVVWGKQAESCGQYLVKGSPIFVEGRLQSRSWESEDGKKHNILEVVALRVQFIGKIKGAQASEAPAPASEGTPAVETSTETEGEEVPF